MSYPEDSVVTVRRSKYFDLKEAVEKPESFREIQERLAEQILLIPKVEAIRLKYTKWIAIAQPSVEERREIFFVSPFVIPPSVKLVDFRRIEAIVPKEKAEPQQQPIEKPVQKEAGPDLSLAQRGQQAYLALKALQEARKEDALRSESPVSAVSMDSASGRESPASCSRSDSRMSFSESE